MRKLRFVGSFVVYLLSLGDLLYYRVEICGVIDRRFTVLVVMYVHWLRVYSFSSPRGTFNGLGVLCGWLGVGIA